MVSRPGTRFDYNNADYIILGKIIERITGKTDCTGSILPLLNSCLIFSTLWFLCQLKMVLMGLHLLIQSCLLQVIDTGY
ncbi:serine hydrolase [Niastella sp. MAH-29]|uniref:Serine hydrolase n=1 Tax=Niastella soli TaxID=2821487 RepID=A0ABS3Z3S3_9BACT|nr:serine hydrolase [Niastella soli]